MPHWEDDQLRDYTGWFHCDDDLINRVWYAGAYTNQLCTINPQHGNALVHLGEINSTQKGDNTGPDTWWSNTTITNGTSCLVDGAKRDRLVWAGDMSIAVPAITVTTYDLISVANSLDSLFNLQNKSNGQLPYAGVGFFPVYSATYVSVLSLMIPHMSEIIDILAAPLLIDRSCGLLSVFRRYGLPAREMGPMEVWPRIFPLLCRCHRHDERH